jgi:membrane protease YdiL (CAAX protease family)
MTQIAVTNALLIFAGPILLARGSRLSHSDLALLGPTPGASFLRGVATWPKVAPYIFGLYALAIRVWPAAKHPVEEMMRARQDAGTSTLAFLGAVILAPAAEELLFRGVLLGALASIRMPNSNPHPTTTEPAASEIESAETKESSPEPDPIVDTTDRGGSSVGFWCANITISVIFAMMHGPIWPSPIPLFLLSLALGVLYRRTGGIAAPIGLHMVFNGVSTLMLQLSLAAGQAPAP